MVSPRKVPSGRWQGSVKTPSGHQKTKVFDKYSDAETWQRVYQDRLDLGFSPVLARTPLAEVAAARVFDLPQGNPRNTGSAVAKKLAAHRLGLVPIEQVRPIAVNEWLVWLSETMAWASVKRYAEELGSIFKWAVDQGYWPYDKPSPTNAAKMPPKPPPKPDIKTPLLNLDWLARVVDQVSCRSAFCADVLSFIGYTGLRWAEVRALQVGDVVMPPGTGQLTVHVVRSRPEGSDVKLPKGGRDRWTPLASAIVPIVEKYSAGREPEDLLFKGSRGGQLWRSRFLVQSGYQKCSSGLTIHDLRHLAACTWIDSGIPVGVVSNWLGHANVQITADVYLKRRGILLDPTATKILNSLPGVR